MYKVLRSAFDGLLPAFSLLPLMTGACLTLACVQPEQVKVRVATATAAELEKVKDEPRVWYEFREGDEIPVELAFFGAMEGGSEGAIFRAKQTFYFVMTKNMPMYLSFDGTTLAGPQSSQTIIGVSPRPDGKGGQLGWLVYMGASGDAEGELVKILEQKKKEDVPTDQSSASAAE